MLFVFRPFQKRGGFFASQQNCGEPFIFALKIFLKMKFLKLDKKKGAGGPSIKSRYAYLIYLDDIDYLPSTDDKGVRLEGDIVLKEDCKMMPLYLTSSSQEFSYDILGDDDEKSYLVKFSGTHPGTELEALEFAKNMIEQPFLVLIPSCNETEPWKLLGELTNPLIFTSSHKAGKDGSKFTFNFEQRIGSEFIYFSYGGVEVPSGGEGTDPPSGGFDPTKWARIDASNIDEHITAWRTKLGIDSINSLQHGPITTTANSVTIGLSPLGENFAVIAGTKYVEPTSNPETPKLFTPVSTGKLKVLIIQALPDAQVFHLVEGVEGTEAVIPDYNGLFVASIIVSDNGEIVTEAGDSSYKNKGDDIIEPLVINDNYGIWTLAMRNTYEVVNHSTSATPTLFGIYTDAKNRVWSGKKFYFKNSSGKILTLKKEPTPPIAGETVYFSFNETVTLKNGETALCFLNRFSEIEVIRLVGSEPFDPTDLQNQITTETIERIAFDDILAGEISAEVVNRAAADLQEKNERVAANALKLDKPLTPTGTKVILDDGTTKPLSEITTDISGKADKPTVDGTWMYKKLGAAFTWVAGAVENIANTDLTNISARIFTQGNTFTWNTAGFFHYLKGLVDKTGQAAYTKVVVVHPTTGETVTRDFADPQATTLAVQNANTTQKTAMRTALLGTATPANPVIFAAAPRFVTRGEVLVDLYGINLTLLDPVFIWIERADSSKIFATNFYNLTPTGFTSQWLLPADLPNGVYTIFIQNGVTVAGLSTGVIEVIDSMTQLSFPTADWKKKNRLNSSGVEQSPGGTRNSHSDNIIQMASIDTPGYSVSDPQTWIGMSYKTLNIFLGAKDWDIKIMIDVLVNSGTAREMPMIGLTETTHSGFTATTALIPNKYMIDMINTYKLSPASPGYAGSGTLYISKSGNQLFFRLYNQVTLTNFSFYQTTIDTSKDYGLFINDNTVGVGGASWSWRRYTVEGRIVN